MSSKQLQFYPTDELIRLPISASAFRTLCRVLERTGGGARKFYMSSQAAGDITHTDVSSKRRRQVRFQEDLRELETSGVLRRTGEKVGNGTNCYEVILNAITGSKSDQDLIGIRSGTGSKSDQVPDRNPITIDIIGREDLREEEESSSSKKQKGHKAAGAAKATARSGWPDETSPKNATVAHHGTKETPSVQDSHKSTTGNHDDLNAVVARVQEAMRRSGIHGVSNDGSSIEHEVSRGIRRLGSADELVRVVQCAAYDQLMKRSAGTNTLAYAINTADAIVQKYSHKMREDEKIRVQREDARRYEEQVRSKREAERVEEAKKEEFYRSIEPEMHAVMVQIEKERGKDVGFHRCGVMFAFYGSKPEWPSPWMYDAYKQLWREADVRTGRNTGRYGDDVGATQSAGEDGKTEGIGQAVQALVKPGREANARTA